MLEVGPVAHGGHCVARLDGPHGRVVFVRHALPGERVRAVITEDASGSFWRADAVEVLSASPERVDAPCRYAGPGRCGGCDWQHAVPAYQRGLKAAVVAEQLQRLAGWRSTSWSRRCRAGCWAGGGGSTTWPTSAVGSACAVTVRTASNQWTGA